MITESNFKNMGEIVAYLEDMRDKTDDFYTVKAEFESDGWCDIFIYDEGIFQFDSPTKSTYFMMTHWIDREREVLSSKIEINPRKNWDF